MSRHNDVESNARVGQSLPQTLNLETSKLPRRLGYGIAILEPSLAIPYLQATRGLQINRIAQLKVFGFKTVIDLGTNEEAARLHRSETEALGMRYINIPVNDVVPSQIQAHDFTQNVVAAGKDTLLVYAPKFAHLGAIWAAHLIGLGAPINFAINQGKNLGMEPNQEAILRIRAANN